MQSMSGRRRAFAGPCPHFGPIFLPARLATGARRPLVFFAMRQEKRRQLDDKAALSMPSFFFLSLLALAASSSGPGLCHLDGRGGVGLRTSPPPTSALKRDAFLHDAACEATVRGRLREHGAPRRWCPTSSAAAACSSKPSPQRGHVPVPRHPRGARGALPRRRGRPAKVRARRGVRGWWRGWCACGGVDARGVGEARSAGAHANKLATWLARGASAFLLAAPGSAAEAAALPARRRRRKRRRRREAASAGGVRSLHPARPWATRSAARGRLPPPSAA